MRRLSSRPAAGSFGASSRPRRLGRARQRLIGGLLFAGCLVLYVVARITGILELEGLAMYASDGLGILSAGRRRVLRALWFPILYLAVALPPPDTLVTLLTQPLKIGISQFAVSLLHGLATRSQAPE